MVNAQEWLDSNYPKEERKEVKELDISNKFLENDLDLSDFVNLEKLDCSNNQFTNTNFLKTLLNREKIERLKINNNKKLSDHYSLDFLTTFVGLKELNISNCPLEGNLKSLKSLKKLEWLDISNTNIKEGLEYLPKRIKNFYCELNYQCGSVEIAKQLSKFSEGIDETGNAKYNLDKWREYRADNFASSIIPLERLFVIRGNIRKFINKWGKETEKNLYDFRENKVNELSELKRPNEFSRYWWLSAGVQWTNRAFLVVGVSLLFINNGQYSQISGAIAIVAPFIETIASYTNDKIYDSKKEKWNEFISDTESLLDNYYELLGILRAIRKSKLGKVNKAFNNLREKTLVFLDSYDEDNNGTVDLEELVKTKVNFAHDLGQENGGKLGNIALAIKNLEKEIINCRRDIEESDEEEQDLINRVKEIKEIEVETKGLILQIEIPPK